MNVEVPILKTYELVNQEYHFTLENCIAQSLDFLNEKVDLRPNCVQQETYTLFKIITVQEKYYNYFGS